MAREKLGSRLGFILLSAGCAIGLGNVYKFPYVAGQNGGAIFVLIYLACLVLLGLPVMTIEFALGRASQKSPARMYQALQPKGSCWHLHGYVALAGNYIMLMCYTTITGWLLQYFVDTAAGAFTGMDVATVEAQFGLMTQEPLSMFLYASASIVMAMVLCSFSLQKGLERITKWMMLALLSIMVVLAVNSCLLEGGAEGLKFYLMPSLDNFLKAGPVNVVVAAMNQSFFSLSLGIGAMAIFGSYLGKEQTLMGEAVNVVCLDTFVALTAGLIIFPACFAYGVQPDSGFNLIFATLPNIFNNLPGGRLWGSLFFLFMSFAALSTVFAVFENILACTRDMFGWSRVKGCLINGIALILLSLPCILGFTSLSHVTIWGMSIMEFEDFVVNSLLLPLGSLVFVVFCTSRYGWGWENFLKEANQGKGPKMARWLRPYVAYVLPVIILAIFVLGLSSLF